MEFIKVIIAGTRDFNDYQLLKSYCNKMLKNYDTEQVEIVSGGARGADRLGERYAEEKRFELSIMRADWDAYGKSAGYRRNEDMAKYATHCICFWDGKSRGTKHMIDLAKRYNLKLKVKRYDK